jgi:hypothetical protein
MTPTEALSQALPSGWPEKHRNETATGTLRRLPEGSALVTVESLSAALEAARLRAAQSDSTGWRYEAIHDDVMCRRDEHGCGCLCHLATALIEVIRRG